MPAELGEFLGTTHRMHPDICRFISEVAYDDRLHPEPGLDRVRVDGTAGLVFVPVAHAGNRVSSTEEAAQVAELVAGLVGKPWTDRHGATDRLGEGDLLVVAPYNAQVARLRQMLPEGVRVGTVDKFQGQEAPVVIYSMASSTVADAPRGLGFLFDVHRLNVAVSRARGLAILVASPALGEVLCRTPEELVLANAWCRYTEFAHSIPTEASVPGPSVRAGPATGSSQAEGVG